MTAPFTTTDGTPVTFFSGKTADGHPWVLAYEGGPTAVTPEAKCIVTGRLPLVCKASGRVRSIEVRLTLSPAVSDLRAMLPHLTADEVRESYNRALFRRAA